MNKFFLKPALILFLFIIILFVNSSNSQTLFRIKKNRLWGFINNKGEVVIEPKFRYAEDFSEHLAPARKNGYFGYIDTTGKYIIPPTFDYGYKFINGYAIVYLNSYANFINLEGKLLTDIKIKSMKEFVDDRSIVTTESNKMGVIDITGKLIIDTIYSKISNFSDGLAIVEGFGVFQNMREIGVIDSVGNMIVPYKKYHIINEYLNGFAKVGWNSYPYDTCWQYGNGFINRSGELVYSVDDALGFHIIDYVSKDSLFIVTSYEHGGDCKMKWEGNRIYVGIMNLKGELIKKDTISNFRFAEGNIYECDSLNRYSVIDRYGNPGQTKTFQREFRNYYINTIFEKGHENNKWGIIDTSCKFIVPPAFDKLHYKGVIDDYFFFGENVLDIKGNIVSKWGVCNIDGNIMIEPGIDDFDLNGFVNGLLKVKVNENYAYVDKKGNYVWRNIASDQDKIINLNIDYRLTSDYVGFSSESFKQYPLERYKYSQRIGDSLDFPEDAFTLVIDKNLTPVFNNKYKGITIYLANTTDKPVVMPAVDNALYLVWEAKDINGKWKTIEDYPNSFCGNSYVNISLINNHYWTFTVPYYEGELKTKLRMALIVGNYFGGNDKKIYSNEIEGSINPAQFWRLRNVYNVLDLFEKNEY